MIGNQNGFVRKTHVQGLLATAPLADVETALSLLPLSRAKPSFFVGGRNIVSIDFCNPVIEAMQAAHADKPGMEWKVRFFFCGTAPWFLKRSFSCASAAATLKQTLRGCATRLVLYAEDGMCIASTRVFSASEWC